MLRSLAAVTTRRPRLSIAVVVLLLVAAIGVATSAGGRYIDDFTVPGIESQKAQDLIEQRFPGQAGDAATVVLTSRSHPLRDAERAIDAAMAEIRRQPHVTSVEGPLSPGHLARDRRTAFATVSYDADAGDLGAAPRERLEDATASLADAGVDVAMSGQVIDAGNEAEAARRRARRRARRDRPPAGGAALGACRVRLVADRAARRRARLRAARAGGDAASTSRAWRPRSAAMLGIGAGIDYALLSASRHQEELRAGRDPAQAAIRTNATAGHAAVTAAGIVLVAISGLLVTGIPFVGKVGVAAGVVVLVTSLVAVLLLPPLFAAAGRKMLPRRERARAPGPASRSRPRRLRAAPPARRAARRSGRRRASSAFRRRPDDRTARRRQPRRRPDPAPGL